MYTLIKLVSGEEIIGEVVGRDEDYVVLHCPFILVYYTNDSNYTMKITLTKFMPFLQSDICAVYNAHITIEQAASEDLVSYYKKNVRQWKKGHVEEKPSDLYDKWKQSRDDISSTEDLENNLDTMEAIFEKHGSNTSIH